MIGACFVALEYADTLQGAASADIAEMNKLAHVGTLGAVCTIDPEVCDIIHRVNNVASRWIFPLV